jgi:hypothetical protein
LLNDVKIDRDDAQYREGREEKREDKKKKQICMSSFFIFFGKIVPKPTTYFSNPLNPSPRIQKKYKKTSLRARDISSVYFQLHAITSVQYSE